MSTRSGKGRSTRARRSTLRSRMHSGASATGRSPTHSATAGAWRSASAKCPTTRWWPPPRRPLAADHEDIRWLYDSFNRRDVEAVLDRLAPDVTWANGLEGGYVEGRS